MKPTEEDKKFICFCAHVRIGDVKKAVADGARTVEEVERRTGAGQSCGACRKMLAELVSLLVEEAE